MNSFRACRIARDQYNFIVKYDSPNRALSIHDINEPLVFQKSFVGTQWQLDNLNRERLDRFCMGFASYSTLSSTILFTEQKICIICMLGRQGLTFKQVKREALDNYVNYNCTINYTTRSLIEMEDMVKTQTHRVHSSR